MKKYGGKGRQMLGRKRQRGTKRFPFYSSNRYLTQKHNRCVESELYIYIWNGVPSFANNTTVRYNRVMDPYSGLLSIREFNNLTKEFGFYKLNGIQIAYAALAENTPPFYATWDINYASGSLVDSVATGFTDDRMECSNKTSNNGNARYFSAPSELFCVRYESDDYPNLQPLVGVVGRNVWQATGDAIQNAAFGAVTIGSLTSSSLVSGVAIGTLKIKYYLSFCKPISRA